MSKSKPALSLFVLDADVKVTLAISKLPDGGTGVGFGGCTKGRPRAILTLPVELAWARVVLASTVVRGPVIWTSLANRTLAVLKVNSTCANPTFSTPESTIMPKVLFGGRVAEAGEENTLAPVPPPELRVRVAPLGFTANFVAASLTISTFELS